MKSTDINISDAITSPLRDQGGTGISTTSSTGTHPSSTSRHATTIQHHAALHCLLNSQTYSLTESAASYPCPVAISDAFREAFEEGC